MHYPVSHSCASGSVERDMSHLGPGSDARSTFLVGRLLNEESKGTGRTTFKPRGPLGSIAPIVSRLVAAFAVRCLIL